MSGSRQQPGLACEECRKKKLRCNRRRPQCNQCEDSGTVCLVNQVRSPRGPKKGHLKALRNRIATLESIINCDQGNLCPNEVLDGSEKYHSDETIQMLSPPQDYIPNATKDECRDIIYSIETSTITSPITPMTPPDHESSDIIEADLDQLYFDRVHPVAPMLHQGRYFSWSQRFNKPASHICLQFAMWALAAASSAHLQHMRESLYSRARSGIETLDHDIESSGAACLQAAQAWLLLTHYEFRYMSYRRAWLTAGRAFRIIQLAKLHEIDRLNNISINMAHPEAWAEAEEKRRTYWLAYCLDRFLNISDEWPLSLNDEALCIYLPVSESDFQHSRPVIMDSLYDEIEASGHKMLPPFAETIVLITLCWHSVAFQRAAHGDKTSPSHGDSWKHHTRLYQMVQQRLMLISLPPSSPELHDPMRLFTNMLANAAVIWFYNILEALPVEIDDEIILVPLYSAYEIVGLAKPLTRSSFFKAHAFSPMLLYLSANFVKTHADRPSTCVSASEDKQQKLEDLKKALRVLQGGNNLATTYLELLDSDYDSFHKLCNLSTVQGCTMSEVTGQPEPPFFLDMNLF
ncbi:transcriptional regulator family: Fungal Specific TF [Penicillium roqueforti]|uniref:transcriptional regulator family: Fungal Specific TF n=1 Tax=Penicillium roqueforti TaxID=5082 RepID=UPI00190E21E9|nr:transcriptional regulator family: Fungal Specific TF [Penicillium roqueforti]KAF9252529.1 transcriptional regulator family: Fungal Specific TF [Penicillium roqueforti]KAI1835599.1 transcriptional regulator family: Fungal Specific TF [Penicillium roqueforti]KAI2675549.1 transcriptional regulator family: Fungal Specific TF [Penicillium roqueforti]KAI2687164.1 transcriptional regulator family: Fungal Specific TF [Penicillium roqueforti]KAI2716178.1 transcriptional regulator family: Fungal Spec